MQKNWLILAYDGNTNFFRVARNVRTEDIADHCVLTADANGWDIVAVIELGTETPVTGIDGLFVDFTAIEDF